MKTAGLNSDEMLMTLVAEAVKQQTKIRSAVRDITLKALQARELGLDQINKVVRNVTQGVSAGLGDKVNVEKALADAIAGMDDALLKVVEANQVALTKLTEGGASFEESSVKKALDELEKFEDRFRDGIQQGAQEAGTRLKQQWASVLEKIPHGGTDTGERVMQTIAAHAKQAQDAMTQSREAGMKVAHTLAQNYATLVSGVLMGLSEALQHGKEKTRKPKAK
jgi:O6-methylguanine-DNA--protein-cysteine methyltransferase